MRSVAILATADPFRLLLSGAMFFLDVCANRGHCLSSRNRMHSTLPFLVHANILYESLLKISVVPTVVS